jgi:type II secretory ATPase GspE/PulE/Tfp pilus assembly ATPase PilB-like protein
VKTPKPDDVPAFVRAILDAAQAVNASDIYWLPSEAEVEVRFRVDGTQVPHCVIAGEVGRQCLTHVKVLAKLLTYRTQIAQDGVIRLDRVELRVATMPTLYGERITLRVLNLGKTPTRLVDLHFDPACLDRLRALLRLPSGLLLLTGPTGSGKTTTIYAMIRELIANHQDPASIISLEDPIESVIPGISQASVGRQSEQEEWGYAEGLKAALRHDVKTLVVGELRDASVAKIALDAALTGHRVITTYHAGDIASVFARLLHQGFEPFLVAAAISGVVAQRLARAKDGHVQPIIALLESSDSWRDFICSEPSLEEIRKRAADESLGDLRVAAKRLVDAAVLSPEVAEIAIR